MLDQNRDILPNANSGSTSSSYLDSRSPFDISFQDTGSLLFRSSSLPSSLSSSPNAVDLEQQALSLPYAVLSKQDLQENTVFSARSYNSNGITVEGIPYPSINAVQAGADSLLGTGGVNQDVALFPAAGTDREGLSLLFSIGTAASSRVLQHVPKMPPGIIAESGFISNQQSIFDGDVYTDREVTNNGQTQFLDGHSLLIGSGVTTRNYGNLEPVEALRSITAQVPGYDSTKAKLLGQILTTGNALPLFDAQQHPLNSIQDVQRHLPSGTSERLNIIKVKGNLTLPAGASLENVVLLFESGGNFNANGAATLKNVHIVDVGSANLGSLKAWDSSILSSSGQIQMNNDARFGGKSLLVTKDGNILFNGATFSTGEQDYLRVIANGGGITFNANAATRGQFRATGDFIQNGESELIGLVRVKGQVRINGSLRFEAEWPKNLPVLAVLDTGISALSPDLDYGNIINAFDYVAQDSDSLLNLGEGSEHGTFLTGLVAALSGNGTGIDGLNDEALIYNSRVTGSGKWADALLDYVDWLKQTGQRNGIALVGSDLIQKNADGSITTRYDLTPQEREALRTAWDAGVLIVVPMGNEGGVASVLGQTSQEHKNVLSVVAIHNDTVAPYSNRGLGSILSAEGGSLDAPVRSLVGSGMGAMLGTSVAAGYMTGYASLIWAENPNLSYRQVIDILTQTATDLGAEGWDEETGYGKVNLQAALDLSQKTEGKPIEASGILIPGSWVGEGKVDPLERPANSDEQADDTREGANNVGSNPNNFSVSGTLKVPAPFPFVGDFFADERDYYKFSLGEASKVNISLTNQQVSSTSYLSLIVQDANGNSISYGTESELPAGEYYIEVRLNTVWTGQEGSYTLNIDTLDSSSPGNGSDPENNPGGSPGGNEQPGDQTGGGSGGFTVDLGFAPVYLFHLTGLGVPTSASTSSNGIKIQIFSNGAIIGTSQGSYPVYGEMWDIYQSQGGASGSLGAPISDPQSSNGGTLQTFENGTLFVKDGKGLLLDQKIFQKYSSIGGTNSFLGAPTEPAAVDQNGFIRQPFENGYIVWNGREAVAYKWVKDSKTNALVPIPDREEYTQSSAVAQFSKYGESLGISSLVGGVIGGAIGGVAGSAIGGVAGSAIGGVAGSAIGGAIGQATSGIGLSASGGLDESWDLPFNLGKIESKLNVYFDSFLSLGMFDIRFPTKYELNYDKAVLPGTTVALEITPTLLPNPYFHTYLGAGFGAGLDISLGYDISLPPLSAKGSTSLSFKFSVENLLAILQDVGVGLDLSLVGTATEFDFLDKDGDGITNEIEVKDDAYQFLNQTILKVLAEPMKVAPEPVTMTAGLGIDTFLKTLETVNIDIRLGLNIQQVSTLRVKGFEIDWDGVMNGNEEFIAPGETGTLLAQVPSNLNKGDKHTLNLTARPEIEVSTVFNLQPQVEFEWNVGDFVFKKLGIDMSDVPIYAIPIKDLVTFNVKESRNFTAWSYKSDLYSVVLGDFVPLSSADKNSPVVELLVG